MLARLREWLFDRAGLTPQLRQSFNKGLPPGVGWLNALGSTAMFLIAVQVVTGIVLAMYYSPHPDAAYESVRYIDREVVMGRLVHGIHHYGASAVVVVVFLHLLRTYFQGAYKPPRELIWLLGIGLFGLILGFGFTGYLLPWDQKAYFGTQVGTQIPGSTPVVGPATQQVLRSGEDVNALTLTRFFAIHVLLLPALLVFLMGAHVLMIWIKGPTAPGTRVGETAPYASRFVDHQLMRDAVVMGLAFGIVFALSLVRPVQLEFKANPTDATYHPHPEWYFLFLFQFLADFGKIPGLGRVEWLGAVLLPTLALLFLALAPWIDRSPERRASRRPLMIGIMGVGLLAVVGLTVRAYALLHPNATPENSLYAHFTDGGARDLDPKQVEAGRRAFAACGGCHSAYADYDGKTARDMSGYGLANFLGDPKQHPRASRLPYYQRFTEFVRGPLQPEGLAMPKYSEEMLSQEKLDAIGAYLSQDPREVAELRHRDPSPMRQE